MAASGTLNTHVLMALAALGTLYMGMPQEVHSFENGTAPGRYRQCTTVLMRKQSCVPQTSSRKRALLSERKCLLLSVITYAHEHIQVLALKIVVALLSSNCYLLSPCRVHCCCCCSSCHTPWRSTSHRAHEATLPACLPACQTRQELLDLKPEVWGVWSSGSSTCMHVFTTILLRSLLKLPPFHSWYKFKRMRITTAAISFMQGCCSGA
eukprot:426896-Pelagomonas_calceolata.AAC.4